MHELITETLHVCFDRHKGIVTTQPERSTQEQFALGRDIIAFLHAELRRHHLNSRVCRYGMMHPLRKLHGETYLEIEAPESAIPFVNDFLNRLANAPSLRSFLSDRTASAQAQNNVYPISPEGERKLALHVRGNEYLYKILDQYTITAKGDHSPEGIRFQEVYKELDRSIRTGRVGHDDLTSYLKQFEFRDRQGFVIETSQIVARLEIQVIGQAPPRGR